MPQLEEKRPSIRRDSCSVVPAVRDSWGGADSKLTTAREEKDLIQRSQRTEHRVHREKPRKEAR